MELSVVDPWGAPASGSAGPSPPPTLAPASNAGPWGPADPWGAASPASPPSADPWGRAPATVVPDPWGDSSSRVNSDPWASTGESVEDVSSQCPLCLSPFFSSIFVVSTDPSTLLASPPAVTPPSADPWAHSVAPAPTPLSGSTDPWAAEGAAPATDGLTSDPWSGSVKQTNGTGTLVHVNA